MHGAAPGLGLGRALRGVLAASCRWGLPTFPVCQGHWGCGGGWEARPACATELENEVEWQRWPQCGGDGDWLDCLAAAQSYTFACLHPLLLASQCIEHAGSYASASTCCLEVQPSGYGTRTHLCCMGCKIPGSLLRARPWGHPAGLGQGSGDQSIAISRSGPIVVHGP